MTGDPPTVVGDRRGYLALARGGERLGEALACPFVLALLLATVGGLGLGTYGALGHRSVLDRSAAVLVYGLFGLANFYLGYLVLSRYRALVGPAADPLGFLPAWLAGPAPTVQVSFRVWS